MRRRGPALEVLFSAFAFNGIWKMTPTRARSSELGTTVRCGNVVIQREGRQISAHKRGPVGERMPDRTCDVDRYFDYSCGRCC